MENLFVSYEQAIALKELGFSEFCLARFSESTKQLEYFSRPTSTMYSVNVDIPTIAQAFRWFRNVHNLHGCIDLYPSTPAHWYIRIDDIIANDYLFHSEDAGLRYDSYESAEQACLDKLIQIVKTK
jgi:hypothetical protein